MFFRLGKEQLNSMKSLISTPFYYTIVGAVCYQPFQGLEFRFISYLKIRTFHRSLTRDDISHYLICMTIPYSCENINTSIPYTSKHFL